jgi:hypothetical protein
MPHHGSGGKSEAFRHRQDGFFFSAEKEGAEIASCGQFAERACGGE